MENKIPTLYILELDSLVVKSAKISTIYFMPFCPKKKQKNNRVLIRVSVARSNS